MTDPLDQFREPQMITLGDVELAVHTAGTGKPIVLLHGWPEIAWSWRHQVEPLVNAGYQVIAPDQRGYGRSSRPAPVTSYDIAHLTGDITALLDHFGITACPFVGHDWGAIVLWNLAIMHPGRVAAVANLSVPLMERGEREWVGFWEEHLGGDFYIVHFNRQPGVADRVMDANVRRYLNNLYRTGQWLTEPPPPAPGMALINLAESDQPVGEPLMSEDDIEVFIEAFTHSGFTGGINWYRNFTRNWEILGNYSQRVEQPTLMIHGQYDMVPAREDLATQVPNLEVHTLPCGHWIQQEQPTATNRLLLDWLQRLDQRM